MKFISVFRAVRRINGQSLNSQTYAMSDQNLKQRLRPLLRFIRLLVLILLLWSAGNGYLFASAALLELSGQQRIALAGGLAFALLFEAGKYFFGAYTLRVLIGCWWRDGVLYQFALFCTPANADAIVGSLKNPSELDFRPSSSTR